MEKKANILQSCMYILKVSGYTPLSIGEREYTDGTFGAVGLVEGEDKEKWLITIEKAPEDLVCERCKKAFDGKPHSHPHLVLIRGGKN